MYKRNVFVGEEVLHKDGSISVSGVTVEEHRK